MLEKDLKAGKWYSITPYGTREPDNVWYIKIKDNGSSYASSYFGAQERTGKVDYGPSGGRLNYPPFIEMSSSQNIWLEKCVLKKELIPFDEIINEYQIF